MEVKINFDLPKPDTSLTTSLANRILELEKALVAARKEKKDAVLDRRLAVIEKLLGKLPDLVNNSRETDRIVSALDKLESRMSKFSLPTIKLINTDTKFSSAVNRIENKISRLTPKGAEEHNDSKLLNVLNKLELRLLRLSVPPSPKVTQVIPYVS